MEIKMSTVLAEINQTIDDDKPHYFSVKYAKVDGTFGEKQCVRKSGISPNASKTGSSTFGYNVKEKGVLQLYDELGKQHFAIKISLITHYNSLSVWH